MVIIKNLMLILTIVSQITHKPFDVMVPFVYSAFKMGLCVFMSFIYICIHLHAWVDTVIIYTRVQCVEETVTMRPYVSGIRRHQRRWPQRDREPQQPSAHWAAPSPGSSGTWGTQWCHIWLLRGAHTAKVFPLNGKLLLLFGLLFSHDGSV